jgi:hypothetical protein
MIEDEVVREVRAAREAFAATHGFDIRAMVAALHEWGIASGREVVTLPPRRPASVGRKPTTLPASQPPDTTPPTSGAPPLTESRPVR